MRMHFRKLAPHTMEGLTPIERKRAFAQWAESQLNDGGEREMTTHINSLADAQTIVNNSGVVDWDWGDERDSAQVLDRLANFLRRNYDRLYEHNDYGDDYGDADLELPPTFNDALRKFIVDELGDDPTDYSL